MGRLHAIEPTRREANRQRTRTAILAAARHCFVQSGIGGTTMDEIAAEAEVARGTLFNYFPSKGDLVGALMLDRTRGLTDLIYREAASDRPFPERIRRVFALSAQALEEALPLSRGLIDPAQQGWSNAVGGWDVVKTLLDAFAHLLATAPDVQSFRSDISIEQMSEMLLSLYSGAVNVWRVNESYPLSARLEKIAEVASEIVQNG